MIHVGELSCQRTVSIPSFSFTCRSLSSDWSPYKIVIFTTRKISCRILKKKQKMSEIAFIIAGIIVLLILLLITIFALLYYSGLLLSVEVGAGAPPILKAIVAYKFAKGPYSDAGNLFNEVTRLAPNCKGIGIYYDNPNSVAAVNLRYAVGAILSEGDVKVEPDVQKAMEAEGFRIIILPEVTNCVRAKFPYINTLSILLAVKKVYPHIDRYIQEHKLCAYPMVEVYESDNIHFMAPLAKQDEFFVPEAKIPGTPEEHREQSLLGEPSLLDTSNATPSYYEDSSYYENSPDRNLRDISEMSHASGESGQMLDSHLDDSDVDHDQEDIQDAQVTSSMDFTSSSEVTTSSDATLPDLSNQEVEQSLQDSGICSGQPSAITMETSLVKERGDDHVSDENDSSSSFEEIHMDDGLHVKAS